MPSLWKKQNSHRRAHRPPGAPEFAFTSGLDSCGSGSDDWREGVGIAVLGKHAGTREWEMRAILSAMTRSKRTGDLHLVPIIERADEALIRSNKQIRCLEGSVRFLFDRSGFYVNASITCNPSYSIA